MTGGGLVENPPRVYGEEIALELDCSSWSLPPLFEWLAKAGNIAPLELARTFNCGIGMLLFVDEAVRMSASPPCGKAPSLMPGSPDGLSTVNRAQPP